MSKFKRIETQFRNAHSLFAALRELEIPHDVANRVNTPSLPLYGYQGDEREEKASIRINRATVNNWSGGASNDIGFAWNGKTFEAIVSNYDRRQPRVQQFLRRLKQTYSKVEVRRQAKAKGYYVSEKKEADGTIRMVLARR